MICENFWAKKDDKEVLKWLPLNRHLIDMGEIMGLLWEHWLSDSQRNFLIKSVCDTSKNLCRFLGLIHDIGKASPAFQKGRLKGFSITVLCIKILIITVIFHINGNLVFQIHLFAHHLPRLKALSRQRTLHNLFKYLNTFISKCIGIVSVGI